jgi:hypothetical protein
MVVFKLSTVDAKLSTVDLSSFILSFESSTRSLIVACESPILASSLACDSVSPSNLVLMSRRKRARSLSVAC